MTSKSEALAAVLGKAGINTRNVTVIGSYAHIDTYKKYQNTLGDLMGRCGFRLVYLKDGVHMDSADGFRMVFQANAA